MAMKTEDEIRELVREAAHFKMTAADHYAEKIADGNGKMAADFFNDFHYQRGKLAAFEEVLHD
jgi:hypothetical protein